MQPRNKRDKLWNCIKDVRMRYVSLWRTLFNWHKNRKLTYHFLTLDDVRQQYKKSDTIFILGGGESINEITLEQWEYIAKHDSFGMNWWPVHKFVPTFYYTNYPRLSSPRNRLADMVQSRREDYSKTVFFVSYNRALQRGIHPRVFPEFFSQNPLCCYYDCNLPIKLEKNRAFEEQSFRKTLLYRGGLSLLLDLVNKLGYKNIILMGIDLINAVHFYDTYSQMQWMFEEEYSSPIEYKRNQMQSTMKTKNNTKLPMDQYIYAVNRYYFKPRNINLFIGSPKSILAKEIPVFLFNLTAEKRKK